jgi:hypothetical protein
VQIAFQLVQTLYWSGLATWFGGVVFIAVAAPRVFRIVREQDPTLPTVLSVNLNSQHSELLASMIVGRLMQAMTRVSLVGAVGVLLGLAGQALLLTLAGATLVQFVIRVCLFVLAAGALAYDWRSLSPKLFRYRQEYIDHADEPDVANAAKDQFDRLGRESVNVLFFQTLLLLGLILFSANVAYTGSISFGD